MIIDGVELVKKEQASNYKIIVLDNGFVVYGSVSQEHQYLVISNCACIRVWGTTKGLGQLANSGPTKDTVLEPQPTTRVHELQVTQIIDCRGEAWTL